MYTIQCRRPTATNVLLIRNYLLSRRLSCLPVDSMASLAPPAPPVSLCWATDASLLARFLPFIGLRASSTDRVDEKRPVCDRRGTTKARHQNQIDLIDSKGSRVSSVRLSVALLSLASPARVRQSRRAHRTHASSLLSLVHLPAAPPRLAQASPFPLSASPSTCVRWCLASKLCFGCFGGSGHCCVSCCW